jgi:hypothetical protein
VGEGLGGDPADRAVVFHADQPQGATAGRADSDWITLWCAVVSVLVRGLSAMGRVALLAACRFRNFALRVAGGLSDRHRPPHREVAICDLTV